ncbi:YggT family protein [Ktedonobacteria bacterium brp13]|nr:YggT family protein [Ktedonobacteria bacterium brp13]
MGNQYGGYPDPRYSDPRYPQPEDPTEAVPYSNQNLGYPNNGGQQQPYYDNNYPQQGYPQQGYQQPGAPFVSGGQVEKREEVYVDRELQRANLRLWLVRFTYFLLSVLLIVLGLRFIFRLLGANSYNAFVSGLYSVSDFFVTPFNGIFGEPSLRSTFVFDVSTLIAMLIYALIFWGIASLIRVLLAPPTSGTQHITTRRRSN